MRPSKLAITTLALLALFLGIAATVEAQSDADLTVEVVSGVQNRVVGVPQDLKVDIKNVGGTAFNSATGWELQVNLDGTCITGSSPNSPCTQRSSPGSSIPPGGKVTVTIPWTATTTQVPAEGPATLTADVHAITGGCAEGAPPSDARCMNNVRTVKVVIALAAVSALSDGREAPGSGELSQPDDPWSLNQIDEDTTCPASPTPVRVGCYVAPNGTVAAKYRIKNHGNARDTFTPELTGHQDYQTAGWEFAFTPTSRTLEPNEEHTFLLIIRVPDLDYQSGLNLGSTDVRALWRSTLNPAVTTTSTPGTDYKDCNAEPPLCENPTLPTLVVDRRPAIQTYEILPHQKGRIGKPLTWSYRINNTGNADDLYEVTWLREESTINDSWQVAGLPRVVPIEAAAFATREITILPPANATVGTYGINITVESRNDEAGKTLRRLNFTVAVEQDYNMTLAGDVTKRLVPGESATYTFTLANTGNGFDNATVELRSNVSNWDAKLSATRVPLIPFGRATFTLTATPPPNTPAGTAAGFFVNVTAGGPRDVGVSERVKVGPEFQRATVISGPNMRVVAPIDSAFIDPGKRFEYDVTVTNIGNVDDNFSFTLVREDIAWVADVTPKFLALKPLAQGTVRVGVQAPSGASVGESTRVLVDITSSVDSARTAQQALIARVSGPDAFVTNLAVNATTLYSGDPVDITLDVGNKGNLAPQEPIKLRLVFVQAGSEIVIGERTYAPEQLPAGRRLREAISWDTTGIDGSGIITAIIDADEAVIEIDESAASNQASLPVTLRTFDIFISTADGLSGVPGQELTYTQPPHVFSVTYRGNQANEPVRIVVASEHGWGREESTINLPRGTPIQVGATLKIPLEPGTATDRLVLTVTPTLRPTSALVASTITSVVDEAPPAITGLTAMPAEVTLGGRVTLTALVRDATGIDNVRVFVTTPDNQTESDLMSKLDATTFTLEREVRIAGAYRFVVEATDSAGNTNSSRLTVGTFVVVPGSKPVITLAEGQATTVKTGAEVRFDITDPAGVAEATYSIAGISRQLAKPGFVMDTTGLTEGTIDVTVRASNIYGVTSSAVFTLTIDNTPPLILGVTIDPADPKANDEVTITIRTSAEVEGVDVLVKRNGQIERTLSAEKVRQGEFRVKFTLGEGDYAFDVTAKDPAGNANLQEGAVKFSARPASALPAPGLVGALAAVGAALIVLRRRRRD